MENSEIIDDHRYENYNPGNTLSNKVETVIDSQKTKPKKVNVSVGDPVYNSSSKKFKYTFTITGTKGSVTGVKYKYGYYKSDGSLYYPSDSNYSGKITPTGNETNFSLSQNFNLDPSKRYHFIFESYYDTEDNVCDSIVKKEFDFWTPAVEVNSNSIQCETKTTTTAKLVWTKPEGDFSHYKIVWFKDGDFSNRLAAYVPKDETSFTITNLLANTAYNAYVFCCSNKNECYINENGVSYKDFWTKAVISDVPFKINKISIYYAYNSSATNCQLNVKISDNGYSGTFKSVTAKWVVQNKTETYTSLLNRLKSSSNNVTLNTSSGTIEMKTLSSSHTYYLQFFVNNSAVSDVFAVRPAWEVNDSYYYLKEYSYECKSNNRVDLTIKWNTSFYGTINCIRWKKTGPLSSNNNWIYQNYTHQSTITLEDNNTSPFTPGSTFDVEFCTDNNSLTGGTVYAAAFITIQETPETVFAENLTASKWSYDSVTLNWAQNNDCDYYNVYYHDFTGDVMAADQISKETPFVTIRGLSKNTYYRFVVVCHTSGIADTITINDWNDKGITQKTNEKNIYVNSVEQTAAGQNSISLRCTNVQHNNSNCIKVYYKSEDETEWNSETFSSYYFSLNNLTPGTKYEIKAVALSEAINNIVQESFPATCVAYTKPAKPSFPSSLTKTSSSIFAFWYFPNGKWSKALLSYSKSGGDLIPLKVIDYEDRNESESRYYNLENLEPGKTYTFRLDCYSDEEMTYGTWETKQVTTSSQ